MRKGRDPQTPIVAYSRARFCSAVEFALVGLLFILCAMRAGGASGAEPQVGAAEPQVGAAEPQVGAAEPQVGAAEPQVGAAEPRVGAAEALGVAELKSKSSGTRYRAAEALGRSGERSAVAALMAAIGGEKVPAAKQAMIEALGRIGERSVSGFLVQIALNDPDPGSRVSAMTALHRLGDAAAWDSIEKLILDPKQPEGVRRSAMVLVGANKGEKALGTLKAAATDKDPGLRLEALDVLSRLDSAGAQREIDNAAADPDEKVKAAAARIKDWRRKQAQARKGRK